MFCLSCAYLLWSSLNYLKMGALVGVGVLISGAIVLLFAREEITGKARTLAFGYTVPTNVPNIKIEKLLENKCSNEPCNKGAVRMPIRPAQTPGCRLNA